MAAKGKVARAIQAFEAKWHKVLLIWLRGRTQSNSLTWITDAVLILPGYVNYAFAKLAIAWGHTMIFTRQNCSISKHLSAMTISIKTVFGSGYRALIAGSTLV